MGLPVEDPHILVLGVRNNGVRIVTCQPHNPVLCSDIKSLDELDLEFRIG